MPDAVRRTDERRLAANEAEHVVLRLLGTGLDAGSAADADERIYDRVERWRLHEARRDGLLADAQAAFLQASAAPREQDEREHGRHQVYEQFHVPVFAGHDARSRAAKV
jgi:hypothetical protein